MYATLLLSVTFVPGTPARLSIVTGAMTTFWYTQHLKPKTWLKNVSCALLMALSPLTSGAAVMHLEALSVAAATGVKRTIWDLVGSTTVALGPLFLALFCGFMGREIFMDVKDYQGDKKAGIETVPVRYGRRFGTAVGFGFYGMMGLVAIMGPLLDLLLGNGVASLEGMGLLQLLQIPVLQRLFSGSLAGIIMCFRANQIYRTEGRDETVLNKAIEEGKFTSLLVLASFLKF
jgi:4-hydroxybenzoate polyprenyltransferase